MQKERPGRPKRLINARQRHITLEEWQWQALEGQAVRGGASVSSLLRQIVTQHLEGKDGTGSGSGAVRATAGRTAEEG